MGGTVNDTYPIEIRRRTLSEALDYVAQDMQTHPERYTPVALTVLLGTFADQARDLERTAGELLPQEKSFGTPMDLLREWLAWWKQDENVPVKLPNALHVRTACTIELDDLRHERDDHPLERRARRPLANQSRTQLLADLAQEEPLSRRIPKSMGLGNDGPADLSQREGFGDG
jgi:hypothetical protein